jgi:hypothetical protein
MAGTMADALRAMAGGRWLMVETPQKVNEDSFF